MKGLEQITRWAAERPNAIRRTDRKRKRVGSINPTLRRRPLGNLYADSGAWAPQSLVYVIVVHLFRRLHICAVVRNLMEANI